MSNYSVIIPTCGRVELLKRAVQSVLKQKSANFEIIVVDDSNTEDASDNQLDKYFKQLNVIYLKSGGAKGGGYCRNLGLSYAKKELVAFLDDDDQWQPDKLYTQSLLMKNSDIALCYTAISICRPNGSLRYSFRKPGYSDHFKSIMKKNFIGTTSSVVAWRSHLQQIEGFDSSLPALQDYDLYIRLLKRWKVVWIDKPLTWYDDQHSFQKVSGSRQRYVNAKSHMLKKYMDEQYYSLLKKSLRRIELLKICRSRQFLKETFLSILKK